MSQVRPGGKVRKGAIDNRVASSNQLNRSNYGAFQDDDIDAGPDTIGQEGGNDIDPLGNRNGMVPQPFLKGQGNDDLLNFVEDKPKIAAANYGIMQRAPSKLDTPVVFTEKQQVKTAKSNMEDYMEIFGVDFPIPALFVINAIIYPVEPRYSLQLVKHTFPLDDDYIVSTHSLNGKSQKGNFRDLFSKYASGLVLRLLKRDQSTLLKVGEVQLGVEEALMEFDHDGEMFAFFFKDTQVLKVTYTDDIENFVDMLKTLEGDDNAESYFVNYCGLDHGYDLSFIEKISFDIGKKFVIGWGGTQVFLMNLEIGQGEVIEINERMYNQIQHCNMKSSNQINDYSYSLFVACQRNDVKQIVVFDVAEDLAIRERHATKYHGQKLESIMTINYQQELSPDYMIMVSHDNKQVLFSNGDENLVLEVMENGKYFNQRKMKQLKNKRVRFITQDFKDGGFYFLACQDYDKSISIEHSNRSSFNASFQRLVEPDTIKVFDFHLQIVGKPFTHEEQKAQKKEIRILSMRDEEFLLDKCSYDEVSIGPPQGQRSSTWQPPQSVKNDTVVATYQQVNQEYVNFIYSPLRAYSVMWPYVVMSGVSNYIFLVNAYDNSVLRRIQVARFDSKVSICETFITQTNDLFVLVLEEDVYSLFNIDLDDSNQFEHDASKFLNEAQYKFKLILSYKAQDVKDKPIKQIHVRGSSSKMKYDMNEKLQVLLLHGDDLYVWIQTHPDDENKFQDLYFASKCSSALYKDEDDTVYFLNVQKDKIKKEMVCQEIRQLNCLFSTFDVVTIYKQQGQTERLKTINLDPSVNKMVIFLRKTDSKGASLKKKNIVKILDYGNNQIIYENEVKNPGLVGRLKTGLYTLSNGHMYFNNNCIKIRYDILESMANHSNLLKEHEVFDQYLNCFTLKPTEKIRAGTPLDSQKNHRFVYVKRDKSMKEASKVTILPYLHERRVYMNTKRLATEYFYTSVITTNEQENMYRIEYKRTMRDRGNVKDIDILQILDKADEIEKYKKIKAEAQAEEIPNKQIVTIGAQDLYPNTKIAQVQPMPPKQPKESQFTSIICMKTNEFKYYVYAQNGILLNRVDFSNLVDAYGHPAQTSSNGQIFVLKKAKDQLEDMIAAGYTIQDQAYEFCSVSVVKLTIFGMQHVKTINLREAMIEQIQSMGLSKDKLYQEYSWLMNSDYEFLQQHVKFDILVNNPMDLLVRISYMEDPENPDDTQLKAPQVDNQIYYYESINKDKKKGILDQGAEITPENLATIFQGIMSQKATCMLRKKNLDEKFIFNRKYFFIWNNSEIEYYKLGDMFIEENKKKLSFSISEEAVGTKIIDIRCGSNPTNIVIIVRYDPAEDEEKAIDTVIWWNMEIDAEEESNEIRDSYLVLWGSAGNPYIVTESKIYFIKQRCSITAFDYEGAIEAFKKSNATLSVHKGHRVDGTKHNWLIFEEYLSLPFDYITFVTKDKIESRDECMLDKYFDPKPYNYVFDRATPFTQGDFVTEDHDQLLKVLTELEKLSVDNIEIINYTNELHTGGEAELNSALHRAVDDGNQRSINYLLEAMSHISTNSSRNYLSIISDLLDFDQFHTYLSELPQQTIVMEEKQMFRCDSPVNDLIITQVPNGSMFFTEDYYGKVMKESDEEGSNPVKVTALKVDWIINTDEGRNFLQNILFTGNLDFFNIEPIQYIVEFLFQRFKLVIGLGLVPVFLFSHLAYFFLMQANNKYNDTVFDLYKNPDDPNDKLLQTDIPSDVRNKVWKVFGICFISWLIQFAQFLIFIYYGGLDYFKKFYSQLDILYLVSVFTTFVLMIIMHVKKELTIADYERLAKLSGQVGVLGYFSLYFKASYFLSLIDSVAPLIDIIIQIMVDVKWFMIVSAWYVAMFAQCYDLIGRNQVKFDNLSEEELENLPYNGFGNSLWYMINAFLGNAETEGFDYGDATQTKYLNVLYFISTFLIITHLLNMLIAIMGDTFGKRAEVQSQIMSRDHLRFVCDNYHLLPLAIQNKNRVKYIITTALAAGDEELTDEQRGEWITSKFQQLEKLVMDKVDKNAQYGQESLFLAHEVLKATEPKQ